MMQEKVVIVSAVHDYRTKKRGSIQALADAFCRQGYATSFLSVRFSPFSLIKNDSRAFLWKEGNSLASNGDVQCYLWRTPFHPFATRSAFVDQAMEPLHDLYACWPNATVDHLLREADVVVVESGLGVVLIPRVRRLNHQALLIYRGADALETIGAHPFLQTALKRHGASIDQLCLLASDMAPPFGFARDRTFLVPQGIHAADFDDIEPSPYQAPITAVSVGSMLFDPSFFQVAAAQFPEIEFHVIGCGTLFEAPANVIIHPEMPFRNTIPYIAHSTIGLAPYRDTPNGHYLAQSSLKLTQYAFLRRPAVCPHYAIGGRRHRFGYSPGDAGEINAAIRAALRDRFECDEPAPLTWEGVVDRLLRPRDFADTALPDQAFERAA